MNTTRRQFLSAGMAVLPVTSGLLAVETPAPGAVAGSGNGRLKLGMVTYNLGKDWDIPTLIENCWRTRFEGVELRTTHRHGVEVTLSPEQRGEVRRRFADSPVELYSLGSAFDYHTPDATRLKADMEATRQYLQLARDVGASGIKVRPNGLPREVPEEKTLEQIGRSLGGLGRTAADLGVQIRLEVHGSGTAQLPRIRRIMDVAGHPNVGVCWNSNQTDLEGAGFDANFDLVKGLINEVHVRDLYLEEYPFRKLFRRLKESGYTGYTLAEIPESTDPIRVMNYFRGMWMAYQDRI